MERCITLLCNTGGRIVNNCFRGISLRYRGKRGSEEEEGSSSTMSIGGDGNGVVGGNAVVVEIANTGTTFAGQELIIKAMAMQLLK